MLLTLLTALSSLTFFASAVLAARHQHAGLGGYILAIFIGVLLAGCNAWIVDKSGTILANLTVSCSKPRQEFWGKVFFVAILLWLPLAAFLGDWVSSAIIRIAA
jgi:hypothetical protein